MFFIYQILITIILLLSPLIIFFRVLKNKEDKVRFKEKLCFFSKKRGGGKLIWFHGASVGEILSIIPLVHEYEKKKSINKILITSNTLSSSKVLGKYKFKKTIHQFFPIDHFFLINKFLKYWRPHIAIFIDSEIWPGMTTALKDKKIPLILINARITKKSFKKWLKFRTFSESIFNKITAAYPQNKETEKILKELKVNKIKNMGNLKLIENTHDKQDNISSKLNIQFKKYKTWVAASTHADEEFFCAKSHIELKKQNKDLITIIIPRHIHRVQEIISKIKNLNLKVVTHSSRVKTLRNIDIYIVDTFGDSKKFFKITNTVLMGGTLVSKGGQNPLEAVRYGTKILHGPYVDNFKDIFKLLKNLKISKKIKSTKQLTHAITFKKDMSRAFKIKKIGVLILKKAIKELETYIDNEPKKT
jgi:3-deoxy-D-manno-octulosonic-acid transferase